MRSLLYISLLLSSVLIGCGALSWNDCGAPLSRTISFQNTVVYPDSPASQQRISLSVQATVLNGFNDASTTVLVTKDGELYLDVTGRTLCTILATTQTSITCPIAPGQYSFNYVYPLPTLPAGTYTVIVSFNDINSGASLGCLSTSLQVSDPSQGANQCSFTSSLAINFGSTSLSTNNQGNGSWAQVGPYGNNAGAAASNLPWGKFVSYKGTSDVIDVGVDLSPYVWGLNGTQYASTVTDSGTLQYYYGDFMVGYRPYLNAPLSNVQTILTGTFQIVLNYQPGRVPSETFLSSGSFAISPEYSQPVGFYYPLIFGGLNNYSLVRQSDGAITAYGQRVWCTCAVDDCGICGGNGRSCGSFITATAAPKHHGLSDYDLAAIIVGVVGGVILLIIIALLVLMLLRRGRENRTVRDDTDLAGPDKPDYGSMAINEVLADHGRPVIN